MIVLRVLRLRRTKDSKQARQKNLVFKSYMTPLFLLIIAFPKVDSLTATGIALYLKMSQNVKIYLA